LRRPFSFLLVEHQQIIERLIPEHLRVPLLPDLAALGVNLDAARPVAYVAGVRKVWTSRLQLSLHSKPRASMAKNTFAQASASGRARWAWPITSPGQKNESASCMFGVLKLLRKLLLASIFGVGGHLTMFFVLLAVQ
jgi:hypothetical protein